MSATETTPPCFFIVGAVRCGTTLLAKLLGAHPQICFSRPKEPHFFALLDGRPAAARLKADYFDRYFAHRTAEHRILGEGSVSYLYSADAIRRITETIPDARFVVSVRNPVDLVYSYYWRLLYQMDEDVRDFAEAWRLQEARADGRNIPKRCRDPRLLRYAEIGRLGHYVGQLFRLAGRERCLVILFDDLAHDPLAEYRRALAFLGIPDDGRTEVPRQRVNKTFKSAYVQQFIVNPPRWMVPTLRHLDANARAAAVLKSIRRRLKRANAIPTKRPPLPAEMRATLQAAYAADIATLSELLGRDLSHWG